MNLSFVAREVWGGIRGNLTFVLSIVLVTFVSLSFVSVAALLQIQLGNLKSYWFDKAQIAIYLCNDFDSEFICPSGAVTLAEQAVIADQLNSRALSPHIDSYYLESQDEAYQRLLQDRGALKSAQYLNPNQLNSTFWVSLADPESADMVVETFESQPGVAAVADQQGYFDPIIGLLNGATLAAGSIATVMLLSAALLTTTTVRLNAFVRRREINIMRMVGASRVSIQLPFILEGLISALFGGALAIGLNLFIVEYYLKDSLSMDLAFTDFVSATDVFAVAPYVMGLGILVAALASGIFTYRHLRI